MQSFLVALIAVVIATRTGAVPAPGIFAAAVLDEGLVSADVKAVVSTPTVAVGLSLPTPKIINARAAEVCGFPVVPLYRVASDSLNDRIFTTDASEIEAALVSGQYVREIVLASVYSNTTGPNVPNAIPLYRLHSAGKTDHFLTTSFEEVQSAVNNDGYTYQGITAYVYPAPQDGCAGTVPLYRQYNPNIVDHQFGLTKPTINSSTGLGPAGYYYEGITGYVFAPQ